MDILIFGATSTLAHALGLRLARKSAHFTLVARNQPELEQNTKELIAYGAKGVTSHTCDFSDTESLIAFLKSISTKHYSHVIIAPGILYEDPNSSLSEMQLAEMTQINFLGPAFIAERMAQHLSQFPSRSTIVGISSVAADRGRASNYPYAATKAAFSTYLSGLGARMSQCSTVHVMTAHPGPFYSKMTAHKKLGFGSSSKESIAKKIERDMDCLKDVSYAPQVWWLIMFVIRHLPFFLFKKLRF